MNEKPFTSKSFTDYLSEGRVMTSRCKGCGEIHLPPRPLCPKCGSRNLEWMELNGKGTVKTFTVIYVPLSSMKVQCPYVVGVVQFDNGPRISGQILNIHDEKKIRIGSHVKAEPVKELDRTRLCFVLSDSS